MESGRSSQHNPASIQPCPWAPGKLLQGNFVSSPAILLIKGRNWAGWATVLLCQMHGRGWKISKEGEAASGMPTRVSGGLWAALVSSRSCSALLPGDGAEGPLHAKLILPWVLRTVVCEGAHGTNRRFICAIQCLSGVIQMSLLAAPAATACLKKDPRDRRLSERKEVSTCQLNKGITHSLFS